MMLRAGNAGSNTADDHVTVIDRDLATPCRARREPRDPDPGRLGRRDARDRRALLGAEPAVLVRVRADRAGPDRDPRNPPPRLDPRARPGRNRTGERRHRGDHQPTRSQPLAARVQDDRPGRASAPRRATLLHRPRRISLPSDPDRPDRRRHRRPRAPPPPTRARRGPHPRRPEHRPSEVPVQAVRAQRGMAGDRAPRTRPDRLDPSTRNRRRARQSRTETAALPTAARRRPTRVPRPQWKDPPPE